MRDLLPFVAEQPLVDHHCHGVLRRDADEAALESMLNEGASWPGGSVFDSQAGFMFRRLCPPVLGLPPHAELGDYVARRAELGATEVSKRFLAAAGASVLCVDTGFTPEPITSPAELADLTGATAHEIVRLERGGGGVAAAGGGQARVGRRRPSPPWPPAWPWRFDVRVDRGLADPQLPAGRTAAGAPRSRRLPGAGWRPARDGRNAPAELTRSRRPCTTVPSLVAAWTCGCRANAHVGSSGTATSDHLHWLLATRCCSPHCCRGRCHKPTGVPVMLLHNYPYHRGRQATWPRCLRTCASTPGCAPRTDLRAHALPALLAEPLELAPYGKFLYSSDAFGLPELYYLGAALFRSALSAHLREGLAEDLYTERTAWRLTRMLCADNAKRAYQLRRSDVMAI